MIFVTIGSMMPFDRLVRAADEIAPGMAGQSFFAQIGEGGAYEPKAMDFARMLSRRDFAAKMAEADLVVAHAGMGSVISAMELRKPIVILPRIAAAGEVNTDHQLATARWLAAKPGIHVALTEQDLKAAIDGALGARDGAALMAPVAPAAFLEKIRNCISAA